jgi:hypothetical protein
MFRTVGKRHTKRLAVIYSLEDSLREANQSLWTCATQRALKSPQVGRDRSFSCGMRPEFSGASVNHILIT